MGFLLRKKSLSELEEETEREEAEEKLLDVQLSKAQKREMIAQLKEYGLTPKHFGFSWARVQNFLKTH